MPVSDTHRFLHGITPATAEKRIWVMAGQTHDLFFHNLFHGCVSLRRTIELWALEQGIELTVYVDRTGALDFSGNADPAEARQMYDGIRVRRPAPPGLQRRPRRTADATTNGSDADAVASRGAQPDAAQGNGASGEAAPAERAQQAAAQAEQAIGGQGQGIRNTFSHLTHLLGNKHTPSLLIMDGFWEFIQALQTNPTRVETALELPTLVRKDWQGAVTSSPNLLVFLADREQGKDFLTREVLPFPTFDVKQMKEPSPEEIGAALERLAPRHGFRLVGAEAIAGSLARHGHLAVSLGSIRRVVNGGNREVTMEQVLQLPPINERAVADIKRELDDLVGLDDLKQKVRQLEAKARILRQKLENGDSNLPEETSHLVFGGNPGTGKTMAAKIVARLFHALGLLRRDSVREITASTVMSSNLGETRENMQRELEGALGGVLFIDEAHQFGDPNGFGPKEAVQALVPMAWNHRHELVIILAGYENKMHEFYAMDEGLERRFPLFNRLHFPDYSPDELWRILLERKLAPEGYSVGPDVEPRLRAVLRQRSSRKGFGNAGGVDNLMAELMHNHAVSPDPASRTLNSCDLPPLVRPNPAIYAEAEAELNRMVGLEPVRRKLGLLLDRISYDVAEEESGEGLGSIELHPGNMLFVGPPGTGKTSVGRLLCDLLFGLGAIDRRVCLTVSRGDLIGEFQGHSAARVRTAIQKARDGILFVDEAYALALDRMDTFGNEAVSELVKQMTDLENSGTVFILAGYEDDILNFLRVNPGLSGRFGETVRFPNFAPADCAELARRQLEGGRFSWEEGLPEALEELAALSAERMGEHFGNARWVKGAIDAGLTRMRSRVQRSGVPTGDPNRRRLTIADLLGEGSDGGSQTASPVSQQPVASEPASVIIAPSAQAAAAPAEAGTQAESGEA